MIQQGFLYHAQRDKLIEKGDVENGWDYFKAQ